MIRKMRLKTALLAIFTAPLLLTGCGGGHYSNPYDGSWSAVFPSEDKSSISATEVIQCGNPPAPLTIKDGAGTTTQTMTCITDILDAAGAITSSYTNNYYYDISVAIDGKGVINAIVNGAPLTGQCISNIGCSAVSTTGKTLSVTR